MSDRQSMDKQETPQVQSEDVSLDLQEGLKKRLENYKAAPNQEEFKGRDTREDDKPVKKKINPLKILLIVLIVVLVLLIGAVAAFMIVRYQGKKALLEQEVVEAEFTVPEELDVKIADENTGEVIYKGKKYCYNEKIVSILCMGIDTRELNESGTVGAGDSGQADTLFLLVIDTDSGKTNILSISRDSMVDVNVYSNKGEYLDTEKLQLCLAYTYGDGREMSCENTARSVSRLLYGIPVNSYAAVDLRAVPILNDAVGGVEVTILEDLTLIDPSLTVGEKITLRGQQAEWYVRSRLAEQAEATADANSYRMERQRQYLGAFAKKVLAATKQDLTLPVTLYNTVSDYMVTNVSASKVAYLASMMVEKGFDTGNILTVPGEAQMGETYAEFYVDEEALYEMILELFYVEQAQ